MTTTQLIRCAACGANNRVSAEKIEGGYVPRCGRCKAPLRVEAAGTQPVVITDATFAAQIERSPLPVLLDLWAPWCGPCRMLAPTIDQLASQFAGRVLVAKLNIDENPRTAGRFNVSSIPTLLILKEGREIDRIVGLQSAAAIAQKLEAVLR
jgi:thioredoxin 2